MLKFLRQRVKAPKNIPDTPYNEYRDPYLESLVGEIRLQKNNIPVTIKEQLKTKEIK